jgi:hypothetical protein
MIMPNVEPLKLLDVLYPCVGVSSSMIALLVVEFLDLLGVSYEFANLL